MSEQQREYPLFSACGLNCGLCPRYHTEGASRCPGCAGEGFSAKHPSCGTLNCSLRHGVEYCFQCEEYPCKRLEGAHLRDSFITHRHMVKDFERAKKEGLASYKAMLDEKVAHLRFLLESCNDGRRKNFYCLAVNLLEPDDVREVVSQLREDAGSPGAKERAERAVRLFEDIAQERGIALSLNTAKRPKG